MNQMYSIINGELVAANEAHILVSDLSIQRGYGIFDYLSAINYKPVFLDDHLERFYSSAAEMEMAVGYERAELKKLIQQLIDKNKIADSGIRITLTGGYSEDGYSVSRPNLLLTQNPLHFNREDFNKGIRLITYKHQRQLPQVKTIDYLMAIRLRTFIKKQNADEVLYHDHNEIRECPRANFFLITKNEEVLTPEKNILRGITRKKILGFSGVDTKEATITLEEISGCKEAFISSTTKNVLPVLEIDGNQIGDGKPGKITREIYEQLLSMKGK